MSSFERLISECRKYGIRLVCAHQHRRQRGFTELLRSSTNQMRNKAYFTAIGGDGAEEEAAQLDCRNEEREIIGWEPIPVPDPQPFEQLLSATPTHPVLIAFRQDCLLRLADILSEKPQREPLSAGPHVSEAALDRLYAELARYENAKAVLQCLNQYLYARMRRKQFEAEGALYALVAYISAHLGVQQVVELTKTEVIQLMLEHPHDRAGLIEQLMITQVEALVPQNNTPVAWQVRRLLQFFSQLVAVGNALESVPILKASGQLQPKLAPEEPVHNVRARRANELAQLPPFRMWSVFLDEYAPGRFQQVEHQLDTLAAPPIVGSARQIRKRLEWMYQYSRRRYAQPRREAMKDIEDQLAHPPGQQGSDAQAPAAPREPRPDAPKSPPGSPRRRVIRSR